MDRFQDQYARMQRWYVRFEQIVRGRLHDVASDNYVDEIYGFFQNCYHLKDWIKNDPSVPASAQQAVEGYIDASRPLSLCADICNATKHLTLRTSRSKQSPEFGKKLFKVGLSNTQPTTIALDYEITTTAGPIDAFRLANECIDAWKDFITSNKLKV